MSFYYNFTAFILLAIGLLAHGQPIEAQAQDDSTRISELERQIEAITRDLETLTLGTEVVDPAQRGALVMAPAA